MVPLLLLSVDMVVPRLWSRRYIAPECVPTDSYRHKPSRVGIGLTQLALLTAFTGVVIVVGRYNSSRNSVPNLYHTWVCPVRNLSQSSFVVIGLARTALLTAYRVVDVLGHRHKNYIAPDCVPSDSYLQFFLLLKSILPGLRSWNYIETEYVFRTNYRPGNAVPKWLVSWYSRHGNRYVWIYTL